MAVNARVAALMSSQWGLVTRRQALEVGMTEEQIDQSVRSGRWASVKRGVYAQRAYVDLLTTHEQRRLLIDRASSLRVSADHVMSHHSAAYLLGLAVLRERKPFTHVGRPGIVGSHLRHGVKHHLAPFSADQVLQVRGVPVLDAARTAVDIARECGYLHGLVAADSAMRAGVTRADLEAAASVMTHWPRRSVVQDVIVSASPLTDSIIETLARDFVTELGFGVPQAQFGLTSDGRTVWCDLRLGRHLFEADGFVKIMPIELGGFAATTPLQVVWDEKERQDFVTGFKTGVSRLTWNDFFGQQRQRALERCRREYIDTCQRFGTDITDLAQYRPRHPRPRPTPRPGPQLPLWLP